MTKRKPTRGDHIRLALDAVRRENIAANVFASHPGLGAARAYALADEFLASIGASPASVGGRP